MNTSTLRTVGAAALGASLALLGVGAVHATDATSSSQFAACTDKSTGALSVASPDDTCPDGETQVTWFGGLDSKAAAKLDEDLAASSKYLAQAKTQLAHEKAALASAHKKHMALQSDYTSANSVSAKVGVLDEMDQQTEAALQQLMEQKSELERTISNAMKSARDAQEATVGDLKAS